MLKLLLQQLYHVFLFVSDVKHSYADIKLAKEKISYIPKIQFKEGLEITVNSMLNK